MILPIYRGDDDRAKVKEYCDQLAKELGSSDYAGDKIRVQIDDRDLRGGEKKWQHIKRGVPLRAEIGPRDIEKDSRLPRPPRHGHQGTDRPPASLSKRRRRCWPQMQNSLYQRALKLREENTCNIDSLDEFKAYFTPKNEDEARDPRRLRPVPLVRRSRDARAVERTQSHDPLRAARRARRSGQMHLHRQAQHEAGDLREGVLERFLLDEEHPHRPRLLRELQPRLHLHIVQDERRVAGGATLGFGRLHGNRMRRQVVLPREALWWICDVVPDDACVDPLADRIEEFCQTSVTAPTTDWAEVQLLSVDLNRA